MDKYTWSPPTMLPDGHRLFFEMSDPFSLAALADDSGATPDQTDDGVLWIDRDKHLVIGRSDSGGELVIIPLKTLDGKETRTMGNGGTAIMLAQLLRMKIQVGHELYAVRVTTEKE